LCNNLLDRSNFNVDFPVFVWNKHFFELVFIFTSISANAQFSQYLSISQHP